MIVGQFHIVSIPDGPLETDAPLAVYPDAVLALPVTFQFLESIAWWYSQIIKRLGSVQNQHFPQRRALQFLGEAFDALPSKYVFRSFFAKPPYHS